MKTKITLFLFLTITINTFAQTSKTMNFDGITRQYIEYVPASYDSSEAVSIVLCLHGLGDNMNNFSIFTGFQNIADTANIIVLTPEALDDLIYGQQTGNAWNSGASLAGTVINNDIDDLGFLGAILDSTILNYNIDTNNIFVMGFSMGGFMTNRLACELNHRVRAAASVAGTIGNALTCSPAAAIPFCHFHGTADGTVPYVNNNYGNDAEELVNYWVGINNCDTAAIIDSIPDIANDGKTVVHYTYANGDDNTEVEFYKIVNGDHLDWLYLPNNDMSITFKIWEFFNKHKIASANNSVNNIEFSDNCILYPNPASSNLRIESDSKIISYQLLSISSNIIDTKSVNRTNLDINVSELNSGVYILKLETVNGILIEKILVE